MQISALGYDEYIGRLGIGRIYQGVLKAQQSVVICDSFGHERTNTTSQIFCIPRVEPCFREGSKKR